MENKTNRFAFLDTWTGLSDKDRAYYLMSLPGDDEPYSLGSDSLPQENVPQGTLTNYHMDDCSTYPGVARDYWLYVPKQYDPAKPACLMIFLDGLNYVNDCNAHILMDNLIAKGEIPVTIGLFVGTGNKGPGLPIYGGTDNRSIEYDSIDDKFANFLIEDLLPEVEKEYSITADPEGRGICGMSSGGIAAFMAAWNRPDAFRKVISHCGSFTNIRGGHLVPTMIREQPKKPIRVSLQTGEKDLDIVFGCWRIANQYMASSLEYMSYDYELHVGVGGHNRKHAAELLPNTMRWIWRDYPRN